MSLLEKMNLKRGLEKSNHNSYVFLSFQFQLCKLIAFRKHSKEKFSTDLPLLAFKGRTFNYHNIYTETKNNFGNAFSPHCFRVFFCVSLQRLGILIKAISVLLRHKTSNSSGKPVDNYLVDDHQSRFKLQKRFFA